MKYLHHVGADEVARLTAGLSIWIDRAERAEAEVARLKAVLLPFAEFAKASSFDRLPDETPMTQGSRLARKQVNAGDFKRARAALSPADRKDE